MKAQAGHESEVKAQGGQEEDVNSVHDESHVSNRHMTWWQNAWWVRVNNGPHLRTARDRRKVWRAAARAAQEVRETGTVAGGEREKREQGKTERRESNTLFARCLPLSHCNHCNNCNSRSSNCSDSALAVTIDTKSVAKLVVELLAMVDLGCNFDVFDDFLFIASDFGASTPCLVGRGDHGT